MRFTRQVGEALNLKLNATPTDLGAGLFVRARLLDKTGTELASLSMTEIDPGIYAENSFVMPNLDQVIAKFKVFNDAGFTDEVCEFPEVVSFYEKDSFDPTLIQPIGQSIKGSISQNNIKGKIEGGAEVKGEMITQQQIKGTAKSGDKIKGKVITQQNIKGVVKDD